MSFSSAALPLSFHASSPSRVSLIHVFSRRALFQASWAEHKKLHRPGPDGWHYATRRGMGRSLTMPEFKYTGDLRPERIGPTRPVCRGYFGCISAKASRELLVRLPCA